MRNESRTAYLNIPRLSIDTALVSVSWGVAVLATRALHQDLVALPYSWMPILYALAFLSVMNSRELYDITAYTYPNRTLRSVVLAFIVATLVLCLMLPFVTVSQEAVDLLAFFTLSSMTILGVRYFLTYPQEGPTNSKRAIHTLFVGNPEVIRQYLDHLEKTSFRMCPIGYLAKSPVISITNDTYVHAFQAVNSAARASENDSLSSITSTDTIESLVSLSYLGTPNELGDVLDQNIIDEVVLAWNRLESNCIDELLKICTARGVLTRVVLDIWQTEKGHSHLHSIGPLPVMVYHHSHLSTPQQAVKRTMDFLSGFLGLLFFFITALIIVPLIRLESKGPAFAQLERIGRNGRPFKQLRYRINRLEIDKDSRLQGHMTRIGRFLFRVHLHYLPSFWNVFIGEMSLVGTRGALNKPVSNSHDRKFWLKPGLTGLWHVWDFDRLLDDVGIQALDETYASDWSLLLDLQILLQTPIISLVHRIIGQAPDGEVSS